MSFINLAPDISSWVKLKLKLLGIKRYGEVLEIERGHISQAVSLKNLLKNSLEELGH